MTQYVETVDLMDYLRSTIVADEIEVEANAIAASDAINDHCQRSFEVPTSATTRTFVPSGSSVLKVHDIADDTDLVVSIDGATTTDYQLEIAPGVPGPISVSGRTMPYAYIRLLSGSWGCSDEATVSITARWGWAETPAAVPLACRILVKDFLAARDVNFGVFQVGDFSRAIHENSAVQLLLAPLRRVEVWGLA
jgi:hypothetical protein